MDAVSSSETSANFYRATWRHIPETSALHRVRINILYHLDDSRSKYVKGKKVKLRGCGRPYVCETSKLPHFLHNRLTDGGGVVSLTRRPPIIPQEDYWYSFLLEAESTPGP
jgi:hypothetical protein